MVAVSDDLKKQLLDVVRNNQEEELKKIVTENNLDVNTLLYKAPKQGIREATLLMIACIYRSDDVVTTLLELGADVNAKDEKRNTALIHLLQYPREYEEPETIEEYDEAIGIVLTIVKILIEKGADAAAENNKGINSLILMASRDYGSEIDLDVIDELLKAGAETLSTTDEGQNAYMIAIDYNRSDIIRMFLTARPTIDLNDTETFPPDGALWYLLKTQRERSSDILRVFLNAQTPVDLNKFSKAEDGLTPLTYAILAQAFDVAEQLVEAGADVNLPDEDNQFTPLMLSTQADVEFLGFLIDKGADINKQVGRENKSAIFEFIESKVPVEKVKFLIEKGADLTLKNSEGKTPFEFAESKGYEEYYEILRTSDEPVEMWKGYTQEDATFFNFILENEESLANVSVCPFCLQYTERKDACKYMTHKCIPQLRHERLYNLYKNDSGAVYWCTVCGRHCFGHRHFALSDTTETRPSELLFAQPGADVFANSSCPLEGGGGPDEKIRRIDGLLRYVCEVQDDVDKRGAKEVRQELIEEAWKAASARAPKTVRDIKAAKKFNIPCGLPSAAPTEAPTEAPDVPNPNPMPVTKGPGTSSISLDDCDQTYQFIHVQPDGSNKEHSLVCKEDVRDMIRNSGGEEDKCPIGEECKGKLHPDEIKDMFADDVDFYEKYRKRFNEKNKVGGKRRKTNRRRTYRARKYRGGNKTGTPIMSKMSGEAEAMCALPAKQKTVSK